MAYRNAIKGKCSFTVLLAAFLLLGMWPTSNANLTGLSSRRHLPDPVNRPVTSGVTAAPGTDLVQVRRLAEIDRLVDIEAPLGPAVPPVLKSPAEDARPLSEPSELPIVAAESTPISQPSEPVPISPVNDVRQPSRSPQPRFVQQAPAWEMTSWPQVRAGRCINPRGEELLQAMETHEVFPIVGRVPGVIYDSFVYERPSHAVSVAEASDGTLVAAFSAGEFPDVSIYVAGAIKHGDGEEPGCSCFKWSRPVRVANGLGSGTMPCWSPVLYQASMPGSPLLLYYKVGPSVDEWVGQVKASHDNGVTWSQPSKVEGGAQGPLKSKLDGLLLVPDNKVSGSSWKAYMHGGNRGTSEATWVFPSVPDLQLPGLGDAIRAVEPTILPWGVGSGSANLMLLMRADTGGESHVLESFSNDGGRQWGPVRRNLLPNPDAGIDAVTLRDGTLLMVYNHVQSDKQLFPLNLALLPPEAQFPIDPATGFPGQDPSVPRVCDWMAAGELENEPGEYSNPTVIQTSDGLVHVMYTWHHARIRHVVIDPAKLAVLPMENGLWPEVMKGGYAARRAVDGFADGEGCLVPVKNRYRGAPRTHTEFCLKKECKPPRPAGEGGNEPNGGKGPVAQGLAARHAAAMQAKGLHA